MAKFKQIIQVFSTTSVLLFLDQLTKWFAQNNFNEKAYIIFKDFFTLAYAQNSGIAWSIPLPQAVLYILPPVIILAAILFSCKLLNYSSNLAQVTASLFFAGAIGNYIDRVVYGYVIDFISIGRWPVFNLADIYITVTAFLIVIFYDKMKR